MRRPLPGGFLSAASGKPRGGRNSRAGEGGEESGAPQGRCAGTGGRREWSRERRERWKIPWEPQDRAHLRASTKRGPARSDSQRPSGVSLRAPLAPRRAQEGSGAPGPAAPSPPGSCSSPGRDFGASSQSPRSEWSRTGTSARTFPGRAGSGLHSRRASQGASRSSGRAQIPKSPNPPRAPLPSPPASAAERAESLAPAPKPSPGRRGGAGGAEEGPGAGAQSRGLRWGGPGARARGRGSSSAAEPGMLRPGRLREPRGAPRRAQETAATRGGHGGTPEGHGGTPGGRARGGSGQGHGGGRAGSTGGLCSGNCGDIDGDRGDSEGL